MLWNKRNPGGPRCDHLQGGGGGGSLTPSGTMPGVGGANLVATYAAVQVGSQPWCERVQGLADSPRCLGAHCRLQDQAAELAPRLP